MQPIKEDYRGQHFMVTAAQANDGEHWANAAIFFSDAQGSQRNVTSGRFNSSEAAIEEVKARAKAEIDKEIELSSR